MLSPGRPNFKFRLDPVGSSVQSAEEYFNTIIK